MPPVKQFSSVKRISSYSLSEKLKSWAMGRKYLDAPQSYVISYLHNVHRHLASLLRAQIKKLDWTRQDGSALLSEEVELACSPIFFLRLTHSIVSIIFEFPGSHERAAGTSERAKKQNGKNLILPRRSHCMADRYLFLSVCVFELF